MGRNLSTPIVDVEWLVHAVLCVIDDSSQQTFAAALATRREIKEYDDRTHIVPGNSKLQVKHPEKLL